MENNNTNSTYGSEELKYYVTSTSNNDIMKEENKITEEKRRENPTVSDDFKNELTSLLNRYSRENHSNTPDGILCKYMIDSLEAFDRAVNLRTMWYDSYSDQIQEKKEKDRSSLKEELERMAKNKNSEEDK